jgi:hypothetical protein
MKELLVNTFPKYLFLESQYLGGSAFLVQKRENEGEFLTINSTFLRIEIIDNFSIEDLVGSDLFSGLLDPSVLVREYWQERT